MSEVVQSGTAAGLLAFLEWAGSRGDMNPGTAKAYSSAVVKVMEIEGDDWESRDVRGLEVDDMLSRFERLRGTNYTPDSMTTYQSRFRKSVEMYNAFLDEGVAGLKALVKERPRRQGSSEAKPKNNGNGSGAKTPTLPAPPDGDLVQYPFPLRSGQMAYLHLPRELPKAEAKRLAAFLDSLAIDAPLELMTGEA